MSTIKSTSFMLLFIGNLMKLIDFKIINCYSEGDTYYNMNRCIYVHKPDFLMLGNIRTTLQNLVW